MGEQVTVQGNVIDHIYAAGTPGRPTLPRPDVDAGMTAGLIVSDLPRMDIVIVEVRNPYHLFVVPGTPELPQVRSMAGIANAIEYAIGVRMEQLPMSPGAILETMWEQGQGSYILAQIPLRAGIGLTNAGLEHWGALDSSIDRAKPKAYSRHALRPGCGRRGKCPGDNIAQWHT